MKRALITGITGQDGSYLAELLLEKGYEVHGTVRQVHVERDDRKYRRLGASSGLLKECHLHTTAIESFPALWMLLAKNQFDACYHLAGQSFVAEPFADGLSTMQININSTHFLLSAIRELQPKCRFYFAGSSEMFGSPKEAPQNEETPFLPRNPYGISKVAAYHLVRNYREVHGLFCACGILYNHESPRRGQEYVTRKITSAVARIAEGKQKTVELGNLDAQRDWGYAPDFVRAVDAIVSAEEPRDYVVATGQLHTVQEFCEVAFGHVGLDWKKHVVVNPRFVRPLEAVPLVGDAGRIEADLGWKPSGTFKEMVCEMVEAEQVAKGNRA